VKITQEVTHQGDLSNLENPQVLEEIARAV
jgi:hypothetical protein